MALTNRYKLVPCTDIIIKRDERQRRVIDTSDLEASIAQRGVLQPIIITDQFELVAGERRLTTCLKLGLPTIPCRFSGDLSPTELQLIELEENIKRKDLDWQDEVRAIARIHELYISINDTWTQQQTADMIGITNGAVSMYLRVARDIADPKIQGASGFRAAYNMLDRIDARAVGDAFSDILEAGANLVEQKLTPTVTLPPVQNQDGTTSPAPIPVVVPAAAPVFVPAASILNLDFNEWAEQYTGQTFNFIHCDFPYGINVFGGSQSGKQEWTGYKDSPDVYWALIATLCKNLDKLMSHSGHLMFWFSMDFYTETLEAFREQAPSLHFNPKPLIWHKTDNVGILSDPKRGPRHVYETALIASREDRLIVKAVSDAYGAPTNKEHHPSTKPEPMLRQFMTMFVDENTRMLDPTCGSGSSLRAAESLGAKTVLGLERDAEHYQNAQSALRQFRALRRASK